MNNTKTIAIVVGGLAVVGVGIWALTRKKEEKTTTTTTTGGDPLQDPSTATQDTLGSFVGNLLSTLWANSRNPQTNTSGDIVCNGVAVPADPYSFDGVNSSNYSAGNPPNSQVAKMQTYLSGLHNDIATVINDSGGVDGFIGPGFKEAYNMARKGCYITGISDLVSKSGA